MSNEHVQPPILNAPKFGMHIENGYLNVTYERQYLSEADPYNSEGQKICTHRSAISIPLTEGLDHGLQLLSQCAPHLLPEIFKHLEEFQQTPQRGNQKEE